jgi:two-component sensor histidine kinase
MTNKIKIEFAPGAFDSFDGTQEELNELIAEIHRMAESGELLEQSDDLDDLDPAEYAKLQSQMSPGPRVLQ